MHLGSTNLQFEYAFYKIRIRIVPAENIFTIASAHLQYCLFSRVLTTPVAARQSTNYELKSDSVRRLMDGCCFVESAKLSFELSKLITKNLKCLLPTKQKVLPTR